MQQSLINNILDIATQAGKVIIAHYHQKSLDIQQKYDKTLVTKADIDSHHYINKSLLELTPDIPVLSEESKHNHDYKIRQHWDDYWLIDPLDGTQNFINKTDEFCINIAYIHCHKPIFGLIYAPIMQTHFYAYQQLGAFKKETNTIRPLKTKTPHHPLRITIGRHSSGNHSLKTHLQQQDNYQLYPMGSALKFAYIAKGQYDYHPKFGPCSEWDTAAGVCLLEEAGGKVIDNNGDVLCYNKSDNLLSPEFFAYGSEIKFNK